MGGGVAPDCGLRWGPRRQLPTLMRLLIARLRPLCLVGRLCEEGVAGAGLHKSGGAVC